MERRQFLGRALLGSAALVSARAMLAQEAVHDTPIPGQTSNLFDMDQDAARKVRRPAKPGASPSMTAAERDTLETHLRCQCGCTLDVYICRTTDFSCQVSPAMHRDVMALVEGGYGAREILDAFVSTYGERVLMAPPREGFNLAGYLMPFAVLGVGSVALTLMLQRMRKRAEARVQAAPDLPRGVAGTSDELSRLNAAIRRDA